VLVAAAAGSCDQVRGERRGPLANKTVTAPRPDGGL